MKKSRTLLLALAGVVILAAAFLQISREPREEVDSDSAPNGETAETAESTESAEEQFISLLEFDPRNFDSLMISRRDEQYTLVPAGPNAYKVADNPKITLLDGVGEAISSTLAMLVSSDIVSSSESEDIDDYGFNDPEASCTVAAGDQQTTLIFGSKNPDGTARYVMREGDPNVYLVISYFTEMLFPRLYDIRVKTIQPVNWQELAKVTVTEGGSPVYTIERFESEDPFDPGLFPFYFTAPFDPPRGVNDSKYFELVEPIEQGITIRGFIDDPQSLETYGLDAAHSRKLIMEAGDGTRIALDLGDKTGDGEGERYALVSKTKDPVLIISAEDTAVAYIEPFSYAESFAALIGIDTISGYELEAGGVQITAEIERSGDEEDPAETYFVNGTEVDEDRFKDFYQVIIGRQIEGVGDPQIIEEQRDADPVLRLVYHHRLEDESVVDGEKEESVGVKKVVELYPYSSDFLLLQIDGGVRSFLVGKYQLDYILEKAAVLLSGKS